MNHVSIVEKGRSLMAMKALIYHIGFAMTDVLGYAEKYVRLRNSPLNGH